MNEQDDKVAHPGNGNNTSQDRIQAKLAIRHRQVEEKRRETDSKEIPRRSAHPLGFLEKEPGEFYLRVQIGTWTAASPRFRSVYLPLRRQGRGNHAGNPLRPRDRAFG